MKALPSFIQNIQYYQKMEVFKKGLYNYGLNHGDPVLVENLWTTTRFATPDQFSRGGKRPWSTAHLVANLQVQVTGFGVETQVNTVTIVTDDVFGSRILTVPPSHQLLESARQFWGNSSACISVPKTAEP